MVVDEYGSELSFQQNLIQFLIALAEVAFPILARSLVDNPDTVDDLFRLCSRLFGCIYFENMIK